MSIPRKDTTLRSLARPAVLLLVRTSAEDPTTNEQPPRRRLYYNKRRGRRQSGRGRRMGDVLVDLFEGSRSIFLVIAFGLGYLEYGKIAGNGGCRF